MQSTVFCMENLILESNNLTKLYGGISALTNVNLKLPLGKIIGLLGPNGSGKTTFIKIAAGLLTPSSGAIRIGGMDIGVETKKIVSYLPERTYFDPAMRVSECLELFQSFYDDFDIDKAKTMLKSLAVSENLKLKTLSKGTNEKVQLVLVMSRKARLYLLDEPIGGVDPAARDYILHTVLDNVNPEASILFSTHLITDVEQILDEVIFLRYGTVTRYDSTDNIRQASGMSVDALFREEFRC